jgi:hypothetical protein
MSITEILKGQTDLERDRRWLTYWVVYSVWVVLDITVGMLLRILPGYSLAKMALSVYMLGGRLAGSGRLYYLLVHPVLKYYKLIFCITVNDNVSETIH